MRSRRRKALRVAHSCASAAGYSRCCGRSRATTDGRRTAKPGRFERPQERFLNNVGIDVVTREAAHLVVGGVEMRQCDFLKAPARCSPVNRSICQFHLMCYRSFDRFISGEIRLSQLAVYGTHPNGRQGANEAEFDRSVRIPGARQCRRRRVRGRALAAALAPGAITSTFSSISRHCTGALMGGQVRNQADSEGGGRSQQSDGAAVFRRVHRRSRAHDQRLGGAATTARSDLTSRRTRSIWISGAPASRRRTCASAHRVRQAGTSISLATSSAARATRRCRGRSS